MLQYGKARLGGDVRVFWEEFGVVSALMMVLGHRRTVGVEGGLGGLLRGGVNLWPRSWGGGEG